MKTIIALFIGSLFAVSLAAQDLDYVRAQIDTLASESMHGRGYVNNGDRLAAKHLLKEFQRIGLKPVKGAYEQKYTFSINTFPGAMEMVAGQKTMKPGYDYQVRAYSTGVTDTFKTIRLTPEHFNSLSDFQYLQHRDLSGYIMVIDPQDFSKQVRGNIPDIVYVNFFGAGGYIVLDKSEKLYWAKSPGTKTPVPHVVFDVLASSWNDADQVVVDVENEYRPYYETSNIYGYVPGTVHPDSFFLIVAHYDHLGRMGSETCYCGAHDNASGTAAVLDLARYFSQPENRPPHSVMFVLFSGEEAGLKGSRHFVNHPPVALDNIRFVLNLDLLGSGSKGVAVVNGTLLEEPFELLKQINQENQYVAETRPRGESARSDHYPFHKKGVPAFFFFTMGEEYREYHTPDDRAEGLPLTAYEGLFRLIRDYVKAF